MIDDDLFDEVCSHCGGTGRIRAKRGERTRQAREILNFLNAKVGRSYPDNQPNMKIIIARLNEGFTVQQIKQVVARQYLKWNGNEWMLEYLRPKTLFGATNFANYVGELGTPLPKRNGHEMPKLR